MNNDDVTNEALLVKLLTERKLHVSTAESCTGGLISSKITDIPGASEVLNECVVTYSNDAKERYLSVSHETLLKYGAVSEQTASEMAEGLIKNLNADIGISVTGIAGPGGGTSEKPVGLVYIGVAIKTQKDILTNVKRNIFSGTRIEVKSAAAETAIAEAIEMIKLNS